MPRTGVLEAKLLQVMVALLVLLAPLLPVLPWAEERQQARPEVDPPAIDVHRVEIG